jgi:hypothetical protein
MTALRKYQLLLGATVALFVYLVATEVVDRYSGLWSLYGELQVIQESAREPQVLEAEQVKLQDRQRKLKESLRLRSGNYEQSRTGAVEFVSALATRTGVRVESLAPSRPDTIGQNEAMAFKLSLVAPFHRTGLFLNQMENGPFSLSINRLEMSREGAPAGAVKTMVEGVVRLGL